MVSFCIIVITPTLTRGYSLRCYTAISSRALHIPVHSDGWIILIYVWQSNKRKTYSEQRQRYEDRQNRIEKIHWQECIRRAHKTDPLSFRRKIAIHTHTATRADSHWQTHLDHETQLHFLIIKKIGPSIEGFSQLRKKGSQNWLMSCFSYSTIRSYYCSGLRRAFSGHLPFHSCVSMSRGRVSTRRQITCSSTECEK